jgi:hypothetical protein
MEEQGDQCTVVLAGYCGSNWNQLGNNVGRGYSNPHIHTYTHTSLPMQLVSIIKTTLHRSPSFLHDSGPCGYPSRLWLQPQEGCGERKENVVTGILALRWHQNVKSPHFFKSLDSVWPWVLAMNSKSSHINSEILESNKGELCFNFEPGEFLGKEV